MKFDIARLYLLPSNLPSRIIEDETDNIRNSSSVFNALYLLEEQIVPIITSIESNGILISSTWLESEIRRLNQLLGSTHQLHSLITILNLKKQQGDNKIDMELSHIKKWIVPLERTSNASFSDFRIKGNWKLFSSYSGRISASQMPLTSMPKRMRKYVISSSSEKELWSIDLNQAELRFLAYYADDKFLLDHFSTNNDMYSYIGNLISNYSCNTWPKCLRNVSKTFLLAWLYGASTNTLMKKLRKKGFYVTTIDIQDILSQLANRMLQAVHYLDTCSTSREVRTFFGYAIPLVEMKKSTKRNFGLQSSVATAIKLLMLEANKLDLEIVHVIHDELWIEVNPSYSNWQELLQLNFEKTINRYHNGFPLNNILKFNQLKGVC
ncbi:DNA polymerase [Staphylococcus haemolyticus]|uniref:DNA polymerase n=1 Tax=Staphylococcus haemolyticus TaxID=1283 RepID=UPI001F0A7BC9|nr:DNA polymerase [Staphylococcus haemolyticus]MCH4390667.1 DNA polymerase [Staphylococcus haemolyticus]